MHLEEREIRQVNLHPRGGSFSINLPTRWLDRHGMSGQVEIVDTSDGILVRPVRGESAPSIEDEPEFPRFLEFLAQDALSHPETLVDPDELLDRIDELIDGVEPL
jgi:hypothetical protein